MAEGEELMKAKDYSSNFCLRGSILDGKIVLFLL